MPPFLKSLKEKTEIAHRRRVKAKIEKELIEHFNDFTKQVIEKFQDYNSSPQLLNALKLGKECRAIAEDIGNNEIYREYPKLIHLVRRFDREIESKIETLKEWYEFDNPDKFRVEVLKDFSYFRYIIQNLKAIINDYKEMEAERERVKEEKISEKQKQKQQSAKERNSSWNNFKRDLSELLGLDNEDSTLSKLRNKAYYIKFPEDKPEIQQDIEKYRNDHSREEIKKITPPINLKEELKLFAKAADKIKEVINTANSIDDYLYIIKLGKEWMNYLENIGEKLYGGEFDTLTYMTLKSAYRKAYLDTENFLTRAVVKYGTEEEYKKSNPKRTYTDNEDILPDINEVIGFYEASRKKLIKRKEKRAIYNQIQADLKEKQKKIAKEQKEREKELKRQERERKIREKESSRYEKELLKKEKEKEKEKEEKNEEEIKDKEKEKEEKNEKEINDKKKEKEEKNEEKIKDKEKEKE